MSEVLRQLLDATAAGPVSEAEARAALARGQALLAAGEPGGAAVALRLAAMVPATRLAAHNLIEAHALPGAFGEWMGLDARIDPADDVFGFFTGHGSWSSPQRDYLADGWRTLAELTLLLERAGRTLTGCAQVLEFASGHGRFTRHLVKALGAGRVTVSDVVPGAVAFSTRHFGVQGFVSTAEPAALRWPGRYELVFVLSLFSHLPRATWGAWLRRLWEAVAPGGALVFTTHGDFAARRAGGAGRERLSLRRRQRIDGHRRAGIRHGLHGAGLRAAPAGGAGAARGALVDGAGLVLGAPGCLRGGACA